MKRKFFEVFLLLFVCLAGLSQKPEEILNRWSASSPIEKVYLHFDRENYIAGETAWFKAYLYAEYQPDTISTTLYVELLNDSSVIVSRKILPVFFGNSTGQFELPDSMKAGYYFVRAYSPTMLNQDAAFIYQQSIFIYGRKNRTDTLIKPKLKKTRLEFFSESGNFITGFENAMAFKITDENGLPVSANGSIKNERNETQVTFSAYHDGMGIFEMTPVANEKYYAMLNGDTTLEKYPLPEQTDKGIVFKIISSDRGKHFELLQESGTPYFKAAYMIGQMQHHVVFRQDFRLSKQNISGTIDVSHLSSGILQVTIFNKDNIPLAERLTFVDNREYIQSAELITDSINFLKKGKNILHVILKDTVVGSFSVSVTDPEYRLYSTRQSNIFSSLLLTADLKGDINNPAYYFSGNSDSIKNSLDLVMMINGWRRFKWTSLLNNYLPASDYKDPGYITLGGRVNIQDTRKFFTSKPFIVFILSPDSSRSIRMTTTDDQGYFRMDSLLFFDQSRLLFKDIRGKKSDPLQVKLSNDSLARMFFLPSLDKHSFWVSEMADENKEKRMEYDYDKISKAEGLMLAGVTVKVKKKKPLEELEEKYESGLFSGFSEHTIDLVNTTEPVTQENIFEYLAYKVPGLNVIRNGFDYSIHYRQMASTSFMGAVPMTIYLDEIETDAGFISSIPASQIALVKVYSSFIGAVGNGAGGVLAIYTKKGTDLYNSLSTDDMIRYHGFSVIKEFYAPDYAVDTAAIKKQDNRITLLWLPNITVSGINSKIPVQFFNNDRTKQFKIVVEGMTTAGKMLMIEKTISPKAF